MVTLDANINGENSEDLKLKPSEYVFCLMQIQRHFKDSNQFESSIKIPSFFLAFIMDENQVDQISIIDHGNVNEKERNKQK